MFVTDRLVEHLMQIQSARVCLASDCLARYCQFVGIVTREAMR